MGDVDFRYASRQDSREWSKQFSIGSRLMNLSQFGWKELRSSSSLFGTDWTAASSTKKHLRNYTHLRTANAPGSWSMFIGTPEEEKSWRVRAVSTASSETSLPPTWI